MTSSNQLSAISTSGCQCDRARCPRLVPGQCPYGRVHDTRDPCRCCLVCGNGIGEYCDPDEESFSDIAEFFSIETSSEKSVFDAITLKWPRSKYHFGLCGAQLRCKSDVSLPKSPSDMKSSLAYMYRYLRSVITVCVCDDNDMVCGTDGVTYNNPCRLKKAAVESGRNIREAHRGKCGGGKRRFPIRNCFINRNYDENENLVNK